MGLVLLPAGLGADWSLTWDANGCPSQYLSGTGGGRTYPTQDDCEAALRSASAGQPTCVKYTCSQSGSSAGAGGGGDGGAALSQAQRASNQAVDAAVAGIQGSDGVDEAVQGQGLGTAAGAPAEQDSDAQLGIASGEAPAIGDGPSDYFYQLQLRRTGDPAERFDGLEAFPQESLGAADCGPACLDGAGRAAGSADGLGGDAVLQGLAGAELSLPEGSMEDAAEDGVTGGMIEVTGLEGPSQLVPLSGEYGEIVVTREVEAGTVVGGIVGAGQAAYALAQGKPGEAAGEGSEAVVGVLASVGSAPTWGPAFAGARAVGQFGRSTLVHALDSVSDAAGQLGAGPVPGGAEALKRAAASSPGIKAVASCLGLAPTGEGE